MVSDVRNAGHAKVNANKTSHATRGKVEAAPPYRRTPEPENTGQEESGRRRLPTTSSAGRLLYGNPSSGDF